MVPVEGYIQWYSKDVELLLSVLTLLLPVLSLLQMVSGVSSPGLHLIAPRWALQCKLAEQALLTQKWSDTLTLLPPFICTTSAIIRSQLLTKHQLLSEWLLSVRSHPEFCTPSSYHSFFSHFCAVPKHYTAWDAGLSIQFSGNICTIPLYCTSFWVGCGLSKANMATQWTHLALMTLHLQCLLVHGQ